MTGSRRSGLLPRLALCGEFSAGKSSIVNLLLGSDTLPTSVLSSTRRPTYLSHAPSLRIEAVSEQGEREEVSPEAISMLAREDISHFDVGMPSELLRYVELLDTPGFADPYHDPQGTLDAVDTADICVWCTLATQAWRASERQTWLSLPARFRTSGILVVTHIDNLAHSGEQSRVRARLGREAGDLFSDIVLLAVPDAMRAAQADSEMADSVLWQDSGGSALVAAIESAVAAYHSLRGKSDKSEKIAKNDKNANGDKKITEPDAAETQRSGSGFQPDKLPDEEPATAAAGDAPPRQRDFRKEFKPSLSDFTAERVEASRPAEAEAASPVDDAPTPTRRDFRKGFKPSLSDFGAEPLETGDPAEAEAVPPVDNAPTPTRRDFRKDFKPSLSDFGGELIETGAPAEAETGARAETRAETKSKADTAAETADVSEPERFLAAVMKTIPDCRATAWIDLKTHEVLLLRGIEPEEAGSNTSLGDAITDLLQGPNIRRIEKAFRRARGVSEDGAHYFQEIFITTSECIGAFLRSSSRPDRALAVVTDKAEKTANFGLVMSRARSAIGQTGIDRLP